MSEKLGLEFIKYLDERFDRLEQKVEDAHEDINASIGQNRLRITELEKDNAHMKGAVTMAGAIGTALGGIITAIITWVKS